MIQCASVFDIGTSSLKGALIDKDGIVYTQSRLFFPQNVQAETWVIYFENMFKQFYDFAVNTKIEIVGICISGNGPSLVLTFDNPKKNDFLFLWNQSVHTPSDAQKKIYKTSIFLPRLDFLNKTYPEEIKNTSYIFSGPEYLIYKLTKNAVTVLPEKRYESAYWNEKQLTALNIRKEILPPLVSLGTLLGFYRNIPVFGGAPDFVAALIGTNTIKPGKACDRAGSSEGINICIKDIPANSKLDGLRLLPSPVPPFWNISYLIEESGNIFYEYIKKNGGSFMDFNVFLEHINKESLCLNNKTEGQLIIEKLIFKVKKGMDLLENASGFKPVYTISGGQANNALWRKIKTEITGREFSILQIPDGELLGNACIVFTALKEYSSITHAAENISQPKPWKSL